MSATLDIRPCGGDGLLADAGSLEGALALLDQLRIAQIKGVNELVPAAKTVLIRFDPLLIAAQDLAAVLHGLDLSPKAAKSGRDILIPTHYDGEDLPEVAALLGLSVEELIAKHEAAVFTVAFAGFAPGFAYLKCSDPELHVPRRASPRVRIPAGSVALAGEFGGIYPSDSPGGWQLLGHTPLKMWDLSRDEPALFAAGDRVRFADIAKGAHFDLPVPPLQKAKAPFGEITVLRADRPALLQDLGRIGHAAQGVSRAGALDTAALIAANRALGNPRDSAALEITFGGISLRCEAPLTFALTGAPCPIVITKTSGAKVEIDPSAPFALDAGEVLNLQSPPSGTYSYLALRGGYKVETLLGSASYDTLGKIGPAPLTAGDRLAAAHNHATSITHISQDNLPKSGDLVTLDIILGPRDEWFTDKGLETLTQQIWQVTAESNRSGKRLSGDVPLERAFAGELASEGAVVGAIQVPHSGQPVLFLADHPLTAGYPVIAVVAPYHLDLAAQIPPSAKIKFNPIAPVTKA